MFTRTATDEVTKLNAELQRKGMQLTNLENTVNKLNSEVNSGKLQIGELRKDISAKANKCTELESQVGKLTKEIRTRDEAISRLQNQVDILKPAGRNSPIVTRTTSLNPAASPKASADPMNALREELADKDRRIAELQASVARMQVANRAGQMQVPQRDDVAEMDAKDRKIAELEAAVARLNAAVPAHPIPSEATSIANMGEAARVKKLYADITMWKDRSESLMADLKNAQRKAEAAEADALHSKSLCQELGNEKAKLESSLQASQTEVANLKELADQSNFDLRRQLQTSETGAASTNKTAAELQNALHLAEARVEELEKNNSTMQGSLDGLDRKHQETMTKLNNTLDENKELGGKLDATLTELEQMENKFNEATTTLKNANEHIQHLQDQVNRLKETVDTKNAEVKELGDMHGSALNTADTNERNVNSMRERAEHAETAVENLKMTTDKLKSQLDEKENQIKEMTDAMTTMDRELTELKATHTSAKDTLDNTMTSTQRLEAKCKELQAEVKNKDDIIAEQNRELDTAREEVNKTHAKLDEFTQRLGAVDGSQDATASRYQTEIDQLNGYLDGKTAECELLTQALEEARGERAEAKKLQELSDQRAANADKALATTKQELDEFKASVAALTDKNESLETMLAHQDMEIKELQAQNSEYKSKALQMDSLQGTYNESQQALDESRQREKERSSQAETAQTTAEEAKQAAINAEGKLANAEQQIADLQIKIQKIEGEIDLHKQHAADANEARAAMDKDLNAALTELAETREKLRTEELKGVDVTKELNEVQAKLSTAEMEIKELRLVGSKGDDDAEDLAVLAGENSKLKTMVEDLTKRAETLEAELQEEREAHAAVKKQGEADAKRLSMVGQMKAVEEDVAAFKINDDDEDEDLV